MHNHHPHPKFSIITVTYNAAKVLEDTIQSIVTQTYKNLEYIIVDGGSTDETLDIIHKYQEHITTVISEPDQGLYDAMNKGIKLATGDYLCFLNAGDGLHEMILCCNGTFHQWNSPAGSAIWRNRNSGQSRAFLYMRRLSAPATLTWKSFKQGMLVCHQAFFARRDLVEPYDLQYRFSADFDWCIRIMKKADVLHNTHLTLIDYLNEGMTTRNHKASLKERFRIMSRHYGWASTVTHHLWFVLRLLYK